MENKKVLFVSNHSGFTKFNLPYIDWLTNHNVRVDNVSPYLDEEYLSHVNAQYDLPICRRPFSIGNVKSVIMLHAILRKGHYDLIHCHTPMGSVVARLAAIGIKNTIVLYTSHGYFFYSGCPTKYWLLYFTVEKLLKFKTDYLVTINQEDFFNARKFKMARFGTYKINSIGYNDKFQNVEPQIRAIYRETFNITNSFTVLYTAQFIDRKNHEFLIRCVPELSRRIPGLKVEFVGDGELILKMQELVEQLGISDSIIFFGERKDVEIFCQSADIYVSTSKQEGFGMGAVEAMACGCPLVISKIRGHIDFCIEGRNGFMFNSGDEKSLIDSVVKLYNDVDLRSLISKNNVNDAKKYIIDNSLQAMGGIYSNILNL